MIRRLSLLLICLTWLGAPLSAQDQAAEDTGFLTRLLQDSLSGAGREVRISGFSGALSSQARMTQMTIADAQGVWITIRDVELDWTRSDLFRGALTVDTFRAGEIVLERLPEGVGDDAPPPEATPFRLPDLPVSVSIANLEAGRIELGESVLGAAAELELQGAASLDGQAFDIDLIARRTDDTAGLFRIAAGYDPQTTDLGVDVTLEEDAGGLTARLLGLPGLPSVALGLRGAAPVADFTADLRLATDGAERLGGTLQLASAEDGAARLRVDVDGDITPLLPPDQRRFFAAGVSLAADAAREPDGTLVLERMELRTGALALAGSVRLDPDLWPRFAEITAEIADPEGQPVRLPLPDAVFVDRADLTLAYDESRGDGWTGALVVDGLDSAPMDADRLAMEGGGTVDRGDGLSLGALTAGFDLSARGLLPEDPALAEVLGKTVTGRLELRHRAGQPFDVRRFDLAAGDARFAGSATIRGLETGLETDLRMTLDTPDLARFRPLAGLELSGAAALEIDGGVTPLSGAFDFDVDGTATGLGTGLAQLDGLLGGKSLLDIAITRDEDGVRLTRMTLASAGVSFAANGTLATAASAFNLAAQLPDLAPLTPEGAQRRAAGAARVSGTARLGANFTLASANLTARLGNEGAPVRLPLGGDGLQIADAALEIGLAGGDTGEWTLSGTVRQPAHPLGRAAALELTGGGRFDGRKPEDLTGLAGEIALALEGLRLDDPGLSAALGGRLSAQARFAFPDADTLGIGIVEARSAASTLSGTLTIADLTDAPVLRPDLSLTTDLSAYAALAGIPLGGSVTTGLTGEARSADGAFDIEASGTARGLAVGQPVPDAILQPETRFAAALAGRGDAVTLRRFTLSNANLSASAEGALAPAPDLALSARLADMALTGVALSGALSVEGTLRRPGEDWLIDARSQGPGGIASRIDGRLRGDGTSDLTASGRAPLGLANLYIAPNRVEGMASYELRLNGPARLDSVTGAVTLEGGEVSVPAALLGLRDLSGGLSLSGGQARLDVRALNTKGGQVAVAGPITLTAPFPADLSATLTRFRLRDPTLYETKLDGTVTLSGPLANGAVIGGRIVLDDTNLQIPSTGLGGGGGIPEIDHVGAGGRVDETRQRAGLVAEETGNGAGPVYGLDLRIDAPGRIFVRGRGLDAELGGRIDLGGTTAEVAPKGRFDLVRGRLSILDRRLDMIEGYAQILGDFDAFVRLVAQTQTPDYDINVIVEGPASEPTVSFTSSPDLPESEVIAQLLFGRDLSSLSTFQALQLANAVATLAGDGDGSLDRLRGSLGLDDLDVTTDEDGNTAVRAGKYISDNVYTDVVVEPDGTSEINLNLDISRSVTAKGGFTSEGDSSIGLFFEKDY